MTSLSVSQGCSGASVANRESGHKDRRNRYGPTCEALGEKGLHPVPCVGSLGRQQTNCVPDCHSLGFPTSSHEPRKTKEGLRVPITAQLSAEAVIYL